MHPSLGTHTERDPQHLGFPPFPRAKRHPVTDFCLARHDLPQRRDHNPDGQDLASAREPLALEETCSIRLALCRAAF